MQFLNVICYICEVLFQRYVITCILDRFGKMEIICIQCHEHNLTEEAVADDDRLRFW